MPRKTRLSLLAFFSVAELAACGGGSGNAGGGTKTGGGTTAAPFAFADSNAGNAAGVVLTGLEQIATSGELLASAAYLLTQNSGRTYFCRTSPTSPPLTIGLQDLDGNGTPSPGDVITVTAGSCVGFSRDLKITLTAIEGAADKVEGTVELKSDGDNPQLHAEGKFAFSAIAATRA